MVEKPIICNADCTYYSTYCTYYYVLTAAGSCHDRSNIIIIQNMTLMEGGGGYFTGLDNFMVLDRRAILLSHYC